MKQETLLKVDPLHSDTVYVMGVALSLALPVLALMVWPSAKSSAYLTSGPGVAAAQSATPQSVPVSVATHAGVAEVQTLVAASR